MGPTTRLISVEALIVDSNGLSLHSKSSSHIVRQSGWNVEVKTLTVDENYVIVGIDRKSYQIMEGSVCKLDIVVVDGDWQTSIALDIYGSTHAPSKQLTDHQKLVMVLRFQHCFVPCTMGC